MTAGNEPHGESGPPAGIWRLVLEYMPDLLMLLDGEGKIFFGNAAVTGVLGYEPGELKGKQILELAHPEDLSRASEALKTALRTPEAVERLEWRLMHRDGSWVSLESAVGNLPAGSAAGGCVVCSRDIRRRSGKEIQTQGEEHLWVVSENALDIILLIDPDGTISYINQACRRILGFEPEEMIGRNSFDFVHPEDLSSAQKIIDRSLQDEEYSPTAEVRVRHKDGSWRYLEGIGKSFLHHPAVRGIVISLRDITDRKRAEESLRESEELYRTLVRISPDAITVVDLEGNAVYVSPQTVRMHGYGSEEELLGVNFITLAAPEEREKAVLSLLEVIRTGTLSNLEIAALRKDGTCFPAEISAALITGPDGDPRSVVAFSRDITGRKRIEWELKERSEELETFAYTLSHDLLTPVALIDGYARAAQDAHGDGREEVEMECLAGIIGAASRMSALIESLLHYAQVGSPETECLVVEPEEVLLEVLTDLEGEIMRKGVHIAIEGELPALLADRVKLRQAFFNLVSNAVKHMGEAEEPAVRIGAAIEGETAVFHVCDNGIGISTELQEKIFEPFKRFSNFQSPGLGIGLSTVKRAVESWGGRVWVESGEGKGASFYFTAPLA